jgi:hypothetical protein
MPGMQRRRPQYYGLAMSSTPEQLEVYRQTKGIDNAPIRKRTRNH